jgi:hypothetical protein
MKYDVKDVPKFQEEVCKRDCIMKGKCIDDARDPHWFLMCPHYFNWKLGIKTFIQEQLEYERTHPEEMEARRKRNLELAKQIQAERRTKYGKQH